MSRASIVTGAALGDRKGGATSLIGLIGVESTPMPSRNALGFFSIPRLLMPINNKMGVLGREKLVCLGEAVSSQEGVLACLPRPDFFCRTGVGLLEFLTLHKKWGEGYTCPLLLLYVSHCFFLTQAVRLAVIPSISPVTRSHAVACHGTAPKLRPGHRPEIQAARTAAG